MAPHRLISEAIGAILIEHGQPFAADRDPWAVIAAWAASRRAEISRDVHGAWIFYERRPLEQGGEWIGDRIGRKQRMKLSAVLLLSNSVPADLIGPFLFPFARRNIEFSKFQQGSRTVGVLVMVFWGGWTSRIDEMEVFWGLIDGGVVADGGTRDTGVN